MAELILVKLATYKGIRLTFSFKRLNTNFLDSNLFLSGIKTIEKSRIDKLKPKKPGMSHKAFSGVINDDFFL